MKSFAEVLENIKMDDIGKWDLESRIGYLGFFEEKRLIQVNLKDNSPHYLGDRAVSQLCGKMDIPAGYFKRCPGELQQFQLNHWLEVFKEKVVYLRMKDNKVRAVLSPRYSRCDNEWLFGILSVLEGEGWQIQKFALSDEYFNLRLLLPKSEQILGMDEDLKLGVNVINSEVGARALIIEILLYKQICSNGMVVTYGKGALLHQEHYGVSRLEFGAKVSDAIERVPDAVEYIASLVKESSEHKINQEELDKWIKEKVEAKVLTLDFSKKLKEEADRWPRTRFGLANAVSRLSQEYESIERRYELDKFAGNLLKAA